MIARLLLILFVWGVSGTGRVQAATYNVIANRDAHLRSSPSGNNYGTITDLQALTGGNTRRPIMGFTLPAIPAGEMITSATIRLYVTQANNNNTVNLHRVTDTWTEGTVTWANTSADFNATAEATVSGISNGGVYVSFPVTALVNGWHNATFANEGVMLLGASGADVAFASRETGTANQRPELIITTVVLPALTVVKSSAVVSDPFNATTNPKAIPGAVIRYTIDASNSANGAADNNSTVVTETMPTGLELFVGDYGAVGSGPLAVADGAVSCGLIYSFVSLANGTDSISFSNNGGASYSYTPIPDGSGYDATVTNVRVNPSGSFAAKTGATNPSCQMQLFARVK